MLQKILWVFFISMVPLIELRGAIPVGTVMELPFWLNYLVCVAGNILPVPFLIAFSKQVLHWLAGMKKIGPFFQKILDKGAAKAKTIGKYELLGLFLFVAFPLPGTGAWTGSLIATLLGLRVRKATLAIALGVALCGIIMGIASFGLFDLITGLFA